MIVCGSFRPIDGDDVDDDEEEEEEDLFTQQRPGL